MWLSLYTFWTVHSWEKPLRAPSLQRRMLQWADLTGHDWCHTVTHPADNVLLVIQAQFPYMLQVRHMPLATRIPNIVTTPCAPCALTGWLPFPPCTIDYLIIWRVKGGDALGVRCCKTEFESDVLRRAAYSWWKYSWEKCAGNSTDRGMSGGVMGMFVTCSECSGLGGG